MAEYLIILDGLRGYGAEFSIAGSFKSARGFATLTAAEAWIAQQQARDAARLDPDPDLGPVPA
jgi:hypothetical protein